MQYTLESDFAKHVRGPELHRVYLLYGSQSLLIEQYEKKLIQKALDGGGNDFNLHRFTGEGLDLQAFYDAVESLPLMAPARCVTLDLTAEQLGAGELKELCAILEDPPATTTVILTVKRKLEKKDRLAGVAQVCGRAGCTVELERAGNGGPQKFLRERAAQYGCELPGSCAAYLVRRCGEDLQQLDSELQKVCAYAGGGIITQEQIDAVAVPVLQAQVYDLSRAVLRGNPTRAMEILDQLWRLRVPAPRILSALSGAIVDLYRGYVVRREAVPLARAAGELGYPKNLEFRLKNAMSDSGDYSPAQLAAMLEQMDWADQALKSTGLEDRLVLEQTVVRLFLASRGGN